MSSHNNHLLVAGAPTPNGRLHLGHIGAQFLKLDVLKRHIHRSGGRATLMFSVDAFDNAIAYSAWKSGISEAELCADFTTRIRGDLDDVAVEFDALLDPTGEEGQHLVADTLAGLDALLAPRKTSVTEQIPHSRHTGSPVTGRFLAGECPVCSRSMLGFACDPCGLYFSPADIRNARIAADPADPLDWRGVANDFIRTDSRAVLDYLRALPLSPTIRPRIDAVAAHMLAEPQLLARWTASEEWGLGTGVAGQVYFNRVMVTLAEAIAFGELTAARLGLGSNPFDHDSGTITVCAYGADNIGTLTVECAALALATGRYRPYDCHLVSEFYLLDGEKMSTSRRHCIWVAEAATWPEYSRDGLRAHMAAIAVPDAEVDMSPAELRAFMKTLNGRLEAVIAAAAAAAETGTNGSSALDRAAKTLDGQAAALQLPHLDLPAVWQSTDEWISRALSDGAGDRRTNLACLAVIAAPLLPDVAAGVWGLLGHPGRPDASGLARLVSGQGVLQ